MSLESEEPQIIEFAAEQLDDAAHATTKKSFSQDFEHIVHGLSLPLYAAVGFSGAIADKLDKTFRYSREDLQDERSSLSQKFSQKVESNKEKFYRQREKWNAEHIFTENDKSIEDLAQDLRHSTENLLKGFIARGHRVSQAYRNGK